MYYSSTIFNQILSFVPRHVFRRLVGQHKTDHYTKKLTTWNQFVLLMYAQATGKESLREIEIGLKTHTQLWNHLGIQTVAKSSLARANDGRNYKIFEALFYELLKNCQLCCVTRNFTFENPLYSLDATTIALCLNLCDWALYQRTKGAVKLHTLLNNRTNIPELITVSTGKVADITAAKVLSLTIPPSSIIVFDRGYQDYTWWNKLNTDSIFFVTRPKANSLLIVSGIHASATGTILADETVWVGDIMKAHYPHALRRVTYQHDDGTVYQYLTNNFILSGVEIALVYKERWRIELFFKWIKQNLKIKSFLGTSHNAVLSQLWVAMIYYLLLSYIKFQTRFPRSLLELTRMVRETLFVRRSLIDLLSLSTETVSRLDTKIVVQGRFEF